MAITLKQVQRGDRQAWERLAAHAQARALRVAQWQGVDPEACWDVVQDSWKKAWEKRSGFRITKARSVEDSFTAWFLVIVARSAIDWLRKNSRTPVPIADPDLHAVIGDASIDSLWEYFPDLSDKERELIEMRLMGFTLQEIADKFEIAIGTVHRRYEIIRGKARARAERDD